MLSIWTSLEICHLVKGAEFFFNPLPDNRILDWSKLKQIVEDILKCI